MVLKKGLFLLLFFMPLYPFGVWNDENVVYGEKKKNMGTGPFTDPFPDH